MLADALAIALLACAPDAMVLADARPPALLALVPSALVLADARAPALLECAPDALVLADARALVAVVTLPPRSTAPMCVCFITAGPMIKLFAGDYHQRDAHRNHARKLI